MPTAIVGSTTMPPKGKSNEKKSEKFEFLISPEWREEFEAEARRIGVTLSAYVRMACREKKDRDSRTAEKKD
jgi:hypothetical protein